MARAKQDTRMRRIGVLQTAADYRRRKRPPSRRRSDARTLVFVELPPEEAYALLYDSIKRQQVGNA
jgi:hypothetical protein